MKNSCVAFLWALRAKAGKLIQDRTGSLATTIAVALVPMLVAIGVAIDFSKMVGVRTSALHIADTASIAAARTLQAEYVRQMNSHGNADRAWEAAKAAAIVEADTFFRSNQPEKGDASFTSTPTFSRDGGQLSVRIDLAATAPSPFMKLLGKEEFSLKVSSVSATSPTGTEDKPIYADVIVMLDRSASMLVGESMADVDSTRKIVFHNGQPCAFACHENAKWKGDPYLRVRADPGIRLKYDAAREAVARFAETANPTYHRIGVYGFGHKWRQADEALIELSNQMTSVATKIRSLGPETVGFNSQTEISYSMMEVYNQVIAKLPKSGDGSSDSKRKIFLVLITDGVESIHHGVDWQKQDKGSPQWPWYDDRVTGAPYMMGYWKMVGTRIERHNNSGNRDAVCKLIKDNVDIAVLEIEYPDITGLDIEYRYENLVKKWQGRISQSLRNCASPQLYFKAETARGAIASAAQSLFKSVTTQKVPGAVKLVQ